MRDIADITAELAARLSGTQKEQLAGALDLILGLVPDMREVARLEKVIKDQNIFVELAVKASEGIYPHPQGGHFIPADGQESVAAFKVAAAHKCSATKDSVTEVLAERAKQTRKWGATHDKQHSNQELAWAAMYYACPDVNNELPEALFDYTGWDKTHVKKPSGHRKNVVIAAALLLAELDRIDAQEDTGESTLGFGLSDAQRNIEKTAKFCQAYCRQDAAQRVDSKVQNVKEGVSCRKTVGNGDCAYNIMLPYYVRTCGDASPEPKTVNIDKCLLREVLDLWEQGIKATSVCCGHGKLVHRHISVMPESVDKMLALGYRPQRFMADKQGASFFPQTLAVFHLDINKGFNWWSEQPLNKEATAEPADKHGETAQGSKCTITPQKWYKVLLQVSEINKRLLERNLVLHVDWADNTWKVFREGIAGELPVTAGTINGENNSIVLYADTSVLPTATTIK